VDFSQLSQMIIAGDHKEAERWTRSALSSGAAPRDIIDRGLIPGMDEVGRRFKSNEYHMPEVLISARAMKTAMALVRPLISGDAGGSRGRVVIGTVRGDLHDIGKNLVAMMLEGAGYEVHDLGVDVPPERFVRAVEEKNADLVGISSLLTTSMPMMKNTVDALRQAELTTRVRIMVGGAPVNQKFADQIGAHGYAPDGATAVEVASRLLEGRAAA
jgi:5-methyltetrahydrofolate--homocysteine methyltransferase